MLLTRPAFPADGRGAARVTAASEQRVALVIGNTGYRHASRLDNPGNDARLMAETLQGLGFQLVGGKALLDLDKRGMDEAVQAFGRDLSANSVALFYYAGHGNEIGGTNYLLPVDANPFKPSDFDFQALSATTVLRQMQDAGTRLNIVILDACRDNPFSGRGLRGSEAGLASMEPPEGTMIAYAAGVGKKAQDGAPGGNSPYTSALAQAMAQSGLTLWQTFNTVGLQVKEDTGGVQKPWISNEPIRGEFCFAGCAGTVPSAKEEELQERIRQLEAAQAAVIAPEPVQPIKRPTVSELPPVRPIPPTKPKTDPVFQNKPDFGIEMVNIPGGTFQMGCGPNDKECSDDEKPRHAVTVPAFAMAKTEITQGQWKAVMDSNPSYFKDCGNGCPVEQVSWNDVQVFIKALNQKTGGHYRLPSEAEWEYAGRAGQDTLYCGGDDADTVAWYGGNSGNKPHPVGGKQPNAFGLYDMSGNVWEWVQDCYHNSYQGAPTDGGSWNGGMNCADGRRVLRGGAFSRNPEDVRCASRSDYVPGVRVDNRGFRIVVSPL